MYIIRDYYLGTPGYRHLQEAVRAHYLQHYGALPEPRPDLFLCLTDSNSDVPGYACLGVSYGDSCKLFSEYYLDRGLDRRYALERARIAEISAFASFRKGCGAGTYLLDNVLKILALRNVGLVTLTATAQVRQLLTRVVDNFDDLGKADPARVKDLSVDWGTYYNQDPRVVAARLSSPSMWKPSSSRIAC